MTSSTEITIGDLLANTDPAKKKLHIGCGHKYMDGWVNLDNSPYVRKDVTCDLELCATEGLPFGDATFDIIYASHTLEHIRNILPLMEELYRVAKPNAKFIIQVPAAGHDSAYADPTHVRFFVPSSFVYFGQSPYGAADYGYRADWITDAVYLAIAPAFRDTPEEHREAIAVMNRNFIDELAAVMTAHKPPRVFAGERQLDAPDVYFIQRKEE